MMEKKKSYPYKKPGLTLIEVIISVALLAILSVPIFTMVNTNVKISQKTELSQQATIIGQKILEYLGAVNEIQLGDESVLSSLGVKASFEKPLDSEEVIGSGITQNNFKLEIKMKNMIQHLGQEQVGTTSNDLMANPLFVISEVSNQLSINGQFLKEDLSLTIQGDIAKICDKSSVCVEKVIENNYVTIYIQGEVLNPYKLSVINQLPHTIALYAQYDANQPKNIKLVTTEGQVDVSFLTKKENIDSSHDESFMNQLSDLYEVSLSITSPKVEGVLFKGTTVSQLNIAEASLGGD